MNKSNVMTLLAINEFILLLSYPIQFFPPHLHIRKKVKNKSARFSFIANWDPSRIPSRCIHSCITSHSTIYLKFIEWNEVKYLCDVYGRKRRVRIFSLFSFSLSLSLFSPILSPDWSKSELSLSWWDGHFSG